MLDMNQKNCWLYIHAAEKYLFNILVIDMFYHVIQQTKIW